MKNKTLSLIISTLVIVLTIFCSDPSKAGAYEYTVGEVQSLIDGKNKEVVNENLVCFYNNVISNR